MGAGFRRAMSATLRGVGSGVLTVAGSVLLASEMSVAVVGCAEREEAPVAMRDSTLVRPSRRALDVGATITLGTGVSRKTGARLGTGRTFELNEKSKVRAFIDLDNAGARGDGPLTFHVVWIDPRGKSFFTKEITYTPNDSSNTIESSISATADRREPGRHLVRVFLFRELIAEKYFELLASKGARPGAAPAKPRDDREL